MNICEAFEKYLWHMEKVRGFSPNTIKQRRIYVGYFIEYTEKNNIIDVESITNADVDLYHVELKDRVNFRGKTNSIGTINTSVRAIKVFLKWCIDYLDLRCKVKPTDIRPLREHAVRKVHLTFSGIKTVVDACENHQDALMIALAFEAGLRIDELRNVRYEDFRGVTLDVIGKGSKHRITYVSYELKREIDNWMSDNNWVDGYIFRPLRLGSDQGCYRNLDSIRVRIKAAFMRYSGVDMHPHMLRHAFALNLLENECSLRSIQKLLGHANIETTMRYLDVTDKFLEKSYREHFGGSVFNPLNVIKA